MDLQFCTAEQWLENEENYLKLLQDKTQRESIPLLNVRNLQELHDKTLVRFVCMVQDMHGPEYYLEKFDVVHKASMKKKFKNGKYSDLTDEEGELEVNFNAPGNVTSERQSFVGISVPCVNKWAKTIELDKYSTKPQTSQIPSSSTVRPKRPLELETDESMEHQTIPHKKLTQKPTNSKENSYLSREDLLNFPLPDPDGKACHLKIYQDVDTIKLNETIEVIGFLSISPIKLEQSDDHEEFMELQTHHPPPSLIPRIHCVAYNKVEAHGNPLVGLINLKQARWQFVRKELLIMLTQLMLGDDLAAEYLLYHFISKVHLRRDTLPLGKFSLNISGVPSMDTLDYVGELYKIFEDLLPKSHYIAMTLENINKTVFAPKKDYDCNRLTSAVLQLSDNTHLVVDETKLCNGSLNSTGLGNVRAISRIIKSQKVAYEFNFYQLDFDCDIPVLVFSEGKSLLPSDIHVALKPDQTSISTFKEILQAARHFLEPNLLNDIRWILSAARKSDYDIPDDMREWVPNEYVKLRESDAGIKPDDLHSILDLTRLVALSCGKDKMDKESWLRAIDLETKRRHRLI